MTATISMVLSLVGVAWTLHAGEIILISGVIGGAGIIFNFTIRPVWKASRVFISLMHRAMESIEWVELQMKPNGGSSLRDAVDCLVYRTDNLETRVQAQERTDALEASQALATDARSVVHEMLADKRVHDQDVRHGDT